MEDQALAGQGLGLIKPHSLQFEKRRPVGRLFLDLKVMRLDQSQSLPRQGLIFHGVIASIRHCSQCSGGQWLRREVSLGAVGRSTMRGMERRYDCAVASLIKSTNSGLSATVGSLAKGFARDHCAPAGLNEPFQERLAI